LFSLNWAFYSLNNPVSNRKTRPTGNGSGSGKKDEFDHGAYARQIDGSVPMYIDRLIYLRMNPILVKN
jgi:hypothetical protein